MLKKGLGGADPFAKAMLYWGGKPAGDCPARCWAQPEGDVGA